MSLGIIDKTVDDNNSSLDFENLVLLKDESNYLVGTVTDEIGVFLFNEKPDNPKFLKESSIGYNNQALNIL